MTVVELHYLSYVIKSDAKAFHIVDIACGDAVELLKDMFLVFLGDADAMITDAQLKLVVDDVGRDGDGRGFGRVFDTIVNQVVYEVGEVKLVGFNNRWVGVEAGVQFPTTVAERQRETLCYFLDNLVYINFFGADVEVLIRHLGTLKDGLHKDAHALVLVVDDAYEVLARGAVLRNAFVAQHLTSQADGG